MAEVFGIDLNGFDDLDYGLSPVQNTRLGTAVAVARRWTTTRGSVWYAKEYGYNVRQHLGAAQTTPVGTIASALEQEAMDDERVQKCTARVSYEPDGLLRIEGQLEATTGPVSLTLTVSELGAARFQAT